MARKPRIIGKELYHHIYAWGNDKHPVFKARAHYEEYLDYLELYGRRYNVDTVAYALMPWHVHLFVFDWLGRLSPFMKALHGQYARFFNRVTGGVGHVFGERFNNKLVQANDYGLWLSRYIHRQAVEAGIVKHPRDYEWTSYPAYMGLAPRRFVKPHVILNQFGRGSTAYLGYEEFVMGDENGPVDWAKSFTSVVGCEEFLKKVETSKDWDDEERMSPRGLIETLSRQLGVKPELLLNPRGRVERALRHEGFMISVGMYGLSASEVARAFGVSPTAVTKVLRR